LRQIRRKGVGGTNASGLRVFLKDHEGRTRSLSENVIAFCRNCASAWGLSAYGASSAPIRSDPPSRGTREFLSQSKSDAIAEVEPSRPFPRRKTKRLRPGNKMPNLLSSRPSLLGPVMVTIALWTLEPNGRLTPLMSRRSAGTGRSFCGRAILPSDSQKKNCFAMPLGIAAGGRIVNV